MMDVTETRTLDALTRAFAALRDVATAAATTPDPVRLARLVADRLRDLFGVDAVGLAWWDDAADALRILASNDPHLGDPEPLIPVGLGAVGRAFARHEALVVDDYRAWHDALGWMRERGLASCAVVPLMVGSRAVGTLSLTNYEPRLIAADQVQLLRLVAAQVGPTLEAARLYAEAELSRREAAAQAARLAASEETMRTVFGALASGILVKDPEGRILDANAWAQDFFGLSLEKMRGRTSDQLWRAFGEDGTELAPTERPGVVALRTGRRVQHFLMEVRRGDGRRQWIQVESAPVIGPDGRPSHVVSSFLDVTERKEAERQARALAQTEKLRALGQMASGVAHDLNQYLGLVVGHGDLANRALERADPDLAGARESLRIAVQAALDGAETVKRLLTFSRPRLDLPTERINVGSLLREVSSLSAPRWRDATQAEGRPITLEVGADEDAWIEGTPDSLREALTNLVFNAVDALPRGGTIRLTARRRTSEVEIAVADTGVGMSDEVRARIFEPFFTTKGERGTGLGLAMVFGVIERHHGQIAVESAPQRGTTFHLTFPAVASPTVGPARTVETPEAPPLQILAIDDDPMLGHLVQLMLTPGGHTVVIATSGEQALGILAERTFDVVISDLGLGTGINGWELGEIVRTRFPATRLCLATGWGAQIDEEQAKRAGILAVLSKPYRLADLKRLAASLR